MSRVWESRVRAIFHVEQLTYVSRSLPRHILPIPFLFFNIRNDPCVPAVRKRIALLTNWKFRSAVSFTAFANFAKYVRVKPLRIFRFHSLIVYQQSLNFRNVTLNLRPEYFLTFCTVTLPLQ